MIQTLKKGMSGDAVRTLQLKLAARGFLKAGEVDGKFGKATDAAVRAFQFSQKLTVDGAAGPKTMEALNAPISDPAPVKKPAELSQSKPNSHSENAAPAAKVPPADAPQPPPRFTADGWYTNARRCVLHAQRIGAAIEPKGAVVHTSDTLPGGMPNVLRRWHEGKGEGNGAHFWLGRRAPTALELIDEVYPSAGLVQMCPINRNGNHAGGPNGAHGRVMVPGSGSPKGWHPNAHYVGIEVDAAGILQKIDGVYRHRTTQKRIPDSEVWLDVRGRPWHKITEYQFEMLAQLLDDLDRVMGRFPTGARIQSNGSYQLNAVTWAAMPGVRFVGHVTLDPVRKRDPGPQLIEWLRDRYGDRG